MSNRSQIDCKLVVKHALKNVITCVHFDVVFGGQSPLIDVTFGLCSGKFKILAEPSFSLSAICLEVSFFLARPGFQVSSVDLPDVILI